MRVAHFFGALWLCSVSSAQPPGAPIEIRPRILGRTLSDREVTLLQVAPRFATAIRMDEPVNSVAATRPGAQRTGCERACRAQGPGQSVVFEGKKSFSLFLRVGDDAFVSHRFEYDLSVPERQDIPVFGVFRESDLAIGISSVADRVDQTRSNHMDMPGACRLELRESH